MHYAQLEGCLLLPALDTRSQPLFTFKWQELEIGKGLPQTNDLDTPASGIQELTHHF